MKKDIYQTRDAVLPTASGRRIQGLTTIRTILLAAFLYFAVINTNTVLAQSWSQQGGDINGVASEGVGLSISMSGDGNTMAIGANTNDLNPGNFISSVKVRAWNGTTWVQKGSTLTAEQAGDGFGFSVSLSADGTVLAVGAHTHSDEALYGEFSFSGRAYVYDWNGTDWALRATALVGDAAQENFGAAVSLSEDGNALVVGAPGAGAGGTLRGVARVYTWNGSSWIKLGTDIEGSTDFENLGTSVSLKVTATESVLAVGAPTYTPSLSNDNTGLVKIYRDSEASWGGSWSSPEILPGSNTGDYFGYSVSLSSDGNRLAVGAPTDGIFSAEYIGYARVYDYVAGSFTQIGSDIVSNLVYDTYGERLALSGNGQYLIIGAKGGTGNEKGRAEVYRYNASVWQQVGSDLIGEAENDLFGQAVAINEAGSVIAIGGSVNSGGGSSAGQVRTFSQACAPPAAPTGSASLTLCSGATVAQLTATGTSLKWYGAASGGTLLNSTTLLTNNTIYYASQTVSACESTDRLAVTVTITITAAPGGNTTQTFCAGATLADVLVTGTGIKWYNGANSSTQLNSSLVLVTNTTYYASQTINGCAGTRLPVVVTINIPAAPTGEANQIFCVPATVADLLVTAPETINWYATATGGTPLAGTVALVDGIYYAGYTQGGCQSPRLPVTVVSNKQQTIWKQIAAGAVHTLGIREDGTLWAWGRDNVAGPVQIGTDKWLSISAGYGHSAGIKADGTLWAWGSNNYGQLGDGTNTNKNAPVQIGADKWLSISAGYGHSAGIKADSTLWVWGGNSHGQLGDGTSTNKNAPVQIGTQKWLCVFVSGYYQQSGISGLYGATLGIKKEGTLWGWGDGSKVGSGSISGTNSPTQIGIDTDWRSIDGGQGHSLGLKQNGTLWAWGQNSAGQLGDGTSTGRTRPVRIGTDTWVSVLGGTGHSLGIKEDGTLWAWGENTFGQLGDGTTSNRATPVQIGTSKWGRVSAGYSYSISLKADGTLWAWGQNSSGQLGDGTNISKSTPVRLYGEANPVVTPTTAVTQPTCSVATGAIALTTTQANVTFSFNNGVDYQIEKIKTDLTAGSYTVLVKTRGGCTSEPIVVTINEAPTVPTAPAGNPTQTFCSGGTVADLTAEGTSIQWYVTETGGTPLATTTALQTGTYYGSQTVDCESINRLAVTITINIPTVPTGEATQTFCAQATVAELTATAPETISWYAAPTGGTPLESTQVLTKDTYYAGYTQNGCENPRMAVAVDYVYFWNTMSAGIYHTLGIQRDGTLWAWGQNGAGQLGDGTTIGKFSPVQIGADKWLQVSGGAFHSLGIKQDGTLWAWGDNRSGQLGDGTTIEKSSPVQIGADKWLLVSGGAFYTLGIKLDGTLWAWGDNNNGQLGDGTNTQRNSPVQIGTDKWLLVSADGRSLGIKQDGTLWAWGNNSGGLLGDGTNTQRNSPVQIGTDNKWLLVSVGVEHSLGIKQDGTLWAWGSNRFGQLGDGTTIQKSSPVQIGTDKWLQVTCHNGYSSLGIKQDGTLWAWGDNEQGQLGDGSTYIYSPVQIGTDTKWLLVSGSQGHSLGIQQDATLWTWGNQWGGTGTPPVWGTPGRLGAAPPPVLAQPTVSLDLANEGQPVLTASAGTDYQWFKNGTVIPGETGATYTITGDNGEGTYAVITTDQRGCASPRSDEVSIYVTGLVDSEGQASVELYPNPAKESILVQGIAEQAQLTIVSMTGQVQHVNTEWLINEKARRVFIGGLTSGVYLLRVQNGKQHANAKFIKQ